MTTIAIMIALVAIPIIFSYVCYGVWLLIRWAFKAVMDKE
jgi:hypothetical protein